MGHFLRPGDRVALRHAETALPPLPVPTQMISNGEFLPLPQNREQRLVQALIEEWSAHYARRFRMDRRRFLASASGMALAFLAMNRVYGEVFAAPDSEDPGAADARAQSLRDQFVFDAQVHFVKQDSPAGSNPANMLNLRRMAGAYLNDELRGREHVLSDIQFENFVKEVCRHHAGPAGLAGGDGPRDRRAQAGQLEGLHDGRPERPVEVSLAPG
jgi:hypothetical protein